MLEIYGNRYWFDTDGNVYSRTKCINGEPVKLKATTDVYGYERYTLTDVNKVQHTVFKHRLVLIVNMIQPKEGQTEVNHKDKDLHNNALSNLEWCSGEENRKHKFSTFIKPSKLRKLSDEDVVYIREHYVKYSPTFGQYALARKFMVSQATIKDLLARKYYKI